MFRIAKPESYVLPSPTPAQVSSQSQGTDRRPVLNLPVPPVLQVASQNAAQCIPLVFEPESAFFTSPVLVLDFQSLYPSIMIAYNLCYSTFLGRIDRFNGEYKLGYTKHDLPDGLITKLQEDITSELTFRIVDNSELIACESISDSEIFSSASRSEWQHVRQAACSRELVVQDVGRDSRHESYDQSLHEGS